MPAPVLRRLGKVIECDRDLPWATSHAALGTVEVLDDRWRVTCTGRDGAGRSQIGLVDLSIEPPHRVIGRFDAPLLGPGVLGAFDDSGVTHSCRIVEGDRVYLFFTGWSLGVTVPFYFAIGEAVSTDGGRSFVRRSPGPVIGIDEFDPFLAASPWVLVDNGTWRMWYVSGVGWTPTPSGPQHRYLIKYAESADGRRWQRAGRPVIDFAGPDEHSISRPVVRRTSTGGYEMYFSSRGEGYRIHRAVSDDGLSWDRTGEVAWEGEAGDWEGEMQAYPYPFLAGDRRFLLYTGNGFGRDGMGLAEER